MSLAQWKLPAALLTSIVIMCSCAGAPGPSPTPRPSGGSPPTANSQPSCDASHFKPSSSGQPEVQGIVAGRNQLWVLLFDSAPLPTGRDIKLVLRMTGTGSLVVAAVGPDGARIAPDWGPEVHGTSSWDTHPGYEWGVGFTFPRAGCWEVVAVRGSLAARVGLPVT